MSKVPGRRGASGVASKWRSASRRSLLFVALAGAVFVGCGDDESASSAESSGKTESLTVTIRSISDAYAPVYWAESEGYFDKEGLDLTIKVGGQGTTANLVAGRADLAGVSQAAAFGIANEGKSPKSVFATDSGSIAYVFTADPKIQSPDQCESMTTSIPGTNVYAWSVLMQEIFSVKWKLAQLTDVPSFASTVVTGRSDCGMGSLSIYQTAVAAGKLRVIFDPTKKEELPSNWPEIGIENVWVGMSDTLEEKRSAVEKFLKGYAAASKDFIAGDSEKIATKVVANKDWTGFTVEALVPNLDALKPSMNPFDGYIPADAWPRTVSFFKAGGFSFLDADDEKWSYENLVDVSYYDAAIGSPN